MKPLSSRIASLVCAATVCAIGYCCAGTAAHGADTGANAAGDADIDYSAWAVDPTSPGPDLPPAGRSLFDHLVTQHGEPTYRVPFPFAVLIEHIRGKLAQQEFLGGTRVAMIPMGRSLQRSAAAPDFFKFPRTVFAVTGEPATRPDDAGVLLKDRLYLGYVEKTAMIEVISYNETAGRFEFQLVKDYRAGAQPKVFYANRAICIACHQNHAPIFSRALWSETNANGKVAALLRAHRVALDSSAQSNIDFPDDIDKSTVRANTLVTLQKLWREGCSDAQDRTLSRRCRAAAFEAILQFGLSGEREPTSSAANYQSRFVATFTRIWRQRWPQGLHLAQSALPDRNPFGDDSSYYGGGGAEGGSFNWVAASHVPAALDPLNPRPARETWRLAGNLDAYRFIPGWTEFFAANDFRALDAQLLQRASHAGGSRAVHQAPCSAVRRRTSFEFECASPPAGARGIHLAGRFDERGGGRIAWLNFGPAGQVRDLILESGPAQRSGAEFLLRAVAKRNGLTARLPDGRALAGITIRWPAETAQTQAPKPIEAHFEVVVLDDFSLVNQAIRRLLAGQPSLFDDGPLVRVNLLRALFAELGMAERKWCCAHDADMPSAVLDIAQMSASAIQRREWQPLFRYCARCHLTREQFPANFLAGNADQVADNLRQCAPRLLVRLSAWRTPAEQRAKSPMPPATALRGLGTTPHRWTGSEELEQLRIYLEDLTRRDGRASAIAELLKDGYEALPRCLPDAK
jgi:hypothetical protein